MGIADEFPVGGADGADVGGIGKLFLIVVLIEEGIAPAGATSFEEWAQGKALDAAEFTGTAEVDERGGEIEA